MKSEIERGWRWGWWFFNNATVVGGSTCV